MPVHETSQPELSTLSEYEIERNKPMPSLNHSAIQINLGAELRNWYKNQYRLVSERSSPLRMSTKFFAPQKLCTTIS